ncbi:MAG: hypothetical protein OEY22_04900 [Candidatus Bathyarchaeota archaeon]|nr:hypothetical protein [Candidatus Bathyarchaeota archaeon]
MTPSVEAVNRSFAERVSLNRQILAKRYWYLPVDDKGHENYQPVGRGVRSSEFCGVSRGFTVCKNVAGHEGKILNGVDCSGKVVVRHRHFWCHKPTCPVCFIRGWSVREARSIEGRFLAGKKRGFDKVEHITGSVAVADRELPESVFRKKCRDALKDRGVLGGCMVFHGYRIDEERQVLVWSPHYHVLGYVEGGFDRCRDCRHKREDCRSCSGLKGREVRGFANDGYLVKVHDVRKTVFGTAWYELNHATVRVGVKRFHCVTWWGNCGNRKFESVKLDIEVLCPVCSEEMVRSVYVGKRFIVRDIGVDGYLPVFADDEFDGVGVANYVDVVGGSGSG